MEAALIPPIKHLSIADDRKVHLALAHLAAEHEEYTTFYREASKRGAFVILDNSAHEFKAGQPIENLLKQADRLRAKEVVLPDTLFDSLSTYSNSTLAMHKLESLGELETYRLMYVPQGTTEGEWVACLNQFANFTCKPKFSRARITLGLSKDYEMWDGGLLHLLDDYLLPVADNIGAQVHLLGWGRDLWEMGRISSKHYYRIRSMDTTKPFTYARAGIDLRSAYTTHSKGSYKVPVYPRRQEDHFGMDLDGQLSLAKTNIGILDTLVYGDPSLRKKLL